MVVVALLALAAFVGELILHIGSFVSRDPRDWIGPDWVLPCASIVLLVLLAGLANLANIRRTRRLRQEGAWVTDANPRWFKPIVWIFVVYALINFFMAFFIDARHGDPVRQSNGAYVADTGHGRPAVAITADEYHRLRRLQVRRGSAVFMLFFLGIAADLLFTLTARKQLRSDVKLTPTLIVTARP